MWATCQISESPQAHHMVRGSFSLRWSQEMCKFTENPATLESVFKLKINANRNKELKNVLSPTRKETSYSDQTLTFATHSKKNSEVCPSNQVSAAAMTSASDEKWRPFNCFLSRVGLSTYQHPCNLSSPASPSLLLHLLHQSQQRN